VPSTSSSARRAVGALILVAAAAFAPADVGCGGTELECAESDVLAGADSGASIPASGSSQGVTWTNEEGILEISNGAIALRFDESSGSLVGLTNAATGTQLLPTGVHASLAAVVDTSTTNLWSANDTIWSMAPILRSISLRAVATGVVVDLVFDVAPCSGVLATQHVLLEAGSRVSTWQTDFSLTASATAVALAIRSPRVAGIALPETETLAWPWHEGALLGAPNDDMRTLEYPVPASMQWTSLYDAQEGIYLGVNDATGQFKELRYGVDPAEAAAGRELSVTFWPYLTPENRSYTTPVVELGVSDDTGWYWGADRYRSWLENVGMYKSAHASFLETMAGWHKSYNWPLNAQSEAYSYCDVTTTLMPAGFSSQYGLSTLAMYGWSYLGLDHAYPDYDWLDGPDAVPFICVSPSDLADAVHSLHARSPSNHVLFYLNARSADVRGDWYPPNRAAVSAKQAGGEPYPPMGYDPIVKGGPDTNYLDLVCPSAQAWIEQLASRAAALRALDTPTGADGIYWDQIAEEKAEHCYDPTHGHDNPRSAGVQGLTRFFERMQADFTAQVGASGFVFAGEGVNDYYAKYMDVASPAPVRPLGYTTSTCDNAGGDLPCGATHAPQLARYVLPLRILGLETQASSGDDTTSDAYAWAFALAEPLRSKEIDANGVTDTNTFALPRYPDIDAAQPTLYFTGRFLDEKGITIESPPNFVDPTELVVAPNGLATVILGSMGDRLGIQLWNATANDEVLGVSVDLAKLGIPNATVSSVADVEGVIPPPPFTTTGAVVRFSAPVAAKNVRAVVVLLE
jgi:hypothetical protein